MPAQQGCGTACSHPGHSTEAQRASISQGWEGAEKCLGHNHCQPLAQEPLAAGQCSCSSCSDLLKLQHPNAYRLCEYISDSLLCRAARGAQGCPAEQGPAAQVLCWGRDSAACQGQLSASPGAALRTGGQDLGGRRQLVRFGSVLHLWGGCCIVQDCSHHGI